MRSTAQSSPSSVAVITCPWSSPGSRLGKGSLARWAFTSLRAPRPFAVQREGMGWEAVGSDHPVRLCRRDAVHERDGPHGHELPVLAFEAFQFSCLGISDAQLSLGDAHDGAPREHQGVAEAFPTRDRRQTRLRAGLATTARGTGAGCPPSPASEHDGRRPSHARCRQLCPIREARSTPAR